MRTIHRTSQFKKDVRRLKKRGRNLNKLKKVLQAIVSERELDTRYRDHALIGAIPGHAEMPH